jgi:hypothetical protein
MLQNGSLLPVLGPWACAAPVLGGVEGSEEAQRAHGKAHHGRQRHVTSEQRRQVAAAQQAGITDIRQAQRAKVSRRTQRQSDTSRQPHSQLQYFQLN